MRLLTKTISYFIFIIFIASSVQAHNFWVNSFESFAHKPGHITVGLGWGHTLPIDDILNSPNGKMVVKEFCIIDPAGNKTLLRIPSSKIAEVEKETANFDVYNADIGLQKIALKKKSMDGVYKIQAKSKPTFYTSYIDTKGRKRLKLKPKDKLKDIEKVMMSVKYQAHAVSYLTLNKWQSPKISNKGLEIIPMTDLSNVKVGDLVEFKVLFMGKPVSSSPGKEAFLTSTCPSFDRGRKFSLYSKIKHGKAEFIAQSAGQWIVGTKHKGKITKEGPLKDLYGKADFSITGSSLTFNVK